MIRRSATNPDMRRRIVDSSLAQLLRGIQVKEAELMGLENLNHHVAVTFQGSVPQMLRPAGERMLLSPILDHSNLADLTPDATRENPILFRNWVKLASEHLAFQLPEASSLTLLEVPEDVFLVSDFGVYSLNFHADTDTLFVTRSLIIPPQRIEPDQYARFVDFCRRVDAAEKRDVVFGSGTH
jgi:hypothetical protein